MATASVNFSTLLRTPADVLPLVVDHDVRLERRDGPDLLLVDVTRERETRSAFDALAAIAALLSDDILEETAGRLEAVLPWAGPLPVASRVEMLRELALVARSAVAFDDVSPVAQLIQEWRATAEVEARPALRDRLMHGE